MSHKYDSFFQETVTSIIGESQYTITSVPEWSKTIAETISSSIQKFDYSGYKYVINCMLIQKSDGGIQVNILKITDLEQKIAGPW